MNAAKKHMTECDWPEHKLLVIEKLKSIETSVGKIDSRFDQMFANQATIAVSQAKASGESSFRRWMWPLILSTITALLALTTIYIQLARWQQQSVSQPSVINQPIITRPAAPSEKNESEQR